MSTALFRLGNACFRAYIRRQGRKGTARVLIATLEWLRWWAEAEKLDFRAAVSSSR